MFRPRAAGWLLSLVLVASAFGAQRAAAAAEGVRITPLSDRLRVEIQGKLFTEYFFTNVPRPYCYPLIGPGDAAMTRDWPMKNPPGEEHDHPHHRSLWYAHGAVNGRDFWTEKNDFGRIVHEKFLKVESGAASGVIESSNRWVAADGVVVCADTRSLRVYNLTNSNERMFDFEITLHASQGELTLGDTKEGTMAARVAESMKLKRPEPHGYIVNSEGARDDQTWGKRAAWCDYYGPVGGRTVGIAIFDHPDNPHHPTWWHVRDYGLFAANPFGRHEFETLSDKNAGALTVPAGGSVTFRYRFYLHEGDEQQAKIAEKYRAYAGSNLPADLPKFQYQGVLLKAADLKYRPHDDIIFPAVLRVDRLITNALGKYYMYYAPHDSPGGICLAYADQPSGPWHEFTNNPVITRDWPPHYRVSHVSGPDVIWNDAERKFFLYFHGENDTTRLATSADGVHFDYAGVAVNTTMFDDVSEASYGRVFQRRLPGLDNRYVMLVMCNNAGTRRIYLAWSADGRTWRTRRAPFLNPPPGTDQVAGAILVPRDGHEYLLFHANNSKLGLNQGYDLYAAETDAAFSRVTDLGKFMDHSVVSADNLAVMSPCLLEDEGRRYLFLNVGPRLKNQIALAVETNAPGMLNGSTR
jgi:hypothetical protein